MICFTIAEKEYNPLLMRLINEQFTKTAFYGSRKMTTWLKREGHKVNTAEVYYKEQFDTKAKAGYTIH